MLARINRVCDEYGQTVEQRTAKDKMKNMTKKEQEAEILRRAIRDLQRIEGGTYCEAWLRSQYDCIVMAMQSDDCVENRALSFDEYRYMGETKAKAIVVDAEHKAQEIVGKACATRENMLKDAAVAAVRALDNAKEAIKHLEYARNTIVNTILPKPPTR